MVDKNLDGSGISVITTMKRKNINSLEGRQTPSSVPSYLNLTGSKHSTPQTVNVCNITPIRGDVKSVVEEWLEKLRK